MLAWCSEKDNNVRVVEVATEQEYANFEGPQLLNKEGNSRSKITLSN